MLKYIYYPLTRSCSRRKASTRRLSKRVPAFVFARVIRKAAPKDHLTDSDFDNLAACDAVVQCFGDCGTSTSISVADAVEMERRGIPSVAVFRAHSAVQILQQTPNVLTGGMPVLVTWTEGPSGGSPPWFEFPRCARRCRHAYLRNGPACRRCHHLD
jgi:hypothetical protein